MSSPQPHSNRLKSPSQSATAKITQQPQQSQSPLVVQDSDERSIHEKNPLDEESELLDESSSSPSSPSSPLTSSSRRRRLRKQAEEGGTETQTEKSRNFLQSKSHFSPLSLAQEQGQQQQKQKQDNKFKWPPPFDDESAIRRNKLSNLPSTNESIKASLRGGGGGANSTNSKLMVRVVTWNQQAKSLPSIEELRRHIFANSSDSDGGRGGSADTNVNVNADIDIDVDVHVHENKYKYNQKFHIIAIGTQECENSFTKSILNPLKTNWERCCSDALGDDYVFIQGHALQASHL